MPVTMTPAIRFQLSQRHSPQAIKLAEKVRGQGVPYENRKKPELEQQVNATLDEWRGLQPSRPATPVTDTFSTSSSSNKQYDPIEAEKAKAAKAERKQKKRAEAQEKARQKAEAPQKEATRKPKASNNASRRENNLRQAAHRLTELESPVASSSMSLNPVLNRELAALGLQATELTQGENGIPTLKLDTVPSSDPNPFRTAMRQSRERRGPTGFVYHS